MRRETLAYPKQGLWSVWNGYEVKDILKRYGATWHPESKTWLASLEACRAANVHLMFKCRLGPFCHMREESEGWVREKEVLAGETRDLCFCDGHGMAKILEVLDDGNAHDNRP